MAQKYSHLSLEDRASIAGLLKAGLSIREIAKELCRAPSTISRELNRNLGSQRDGLYLARQIQEEHEKRWRERRKRPRLKCEQLRRYVEEKLKVGWTPEQISGRWNKRKTAVTISHEAIYQYVYSERRDLLRYLARGRKRHLSRRGRRKRRVHQIPQRTPISKRPKAANLRKEIGHWEVDTMFCLKGSGALLIAVERKTRLIQLKRIKRKTAAEVRKALVMKLGRFQSRWRKTLTFDNGLENVDHLLVNEILGTDSFFCEPFHSWEKGSVENSAGLVRRFFPKRTDFSLVRSSQVAQVERFINTRPRKCLGYLTPFEVFKQQ